ncbi:DUF5518 domain-containing protein [Natrinema gelatinilyticum]|uniref:DUF5518 domain-containing protein n=1 Tax=Natrinema gelatinilyticum TaxID=2961571 RepID=UPI0020C4694C|nr:DUF5518 domain-containing protein [Natrinema gelatinilyticum]
MSPSSLRVRTLPAAWRFAIIGALASLPATVVVNWLPDSEATIGGSIMIIGAFIAGVIAAIRSMDPGAAGLRTGVLAGVVAVLTLLVAVFSTVLSDATVTWPSLSRVVFVVLASGLALCVAPIFGLVCGRVGGWMANTVTSRLTTGADAS